MKWIMALLVIFVLVTVVFYAFPKLNYRDMPKGLCQAELDEQKPNWVSSLVDEQNAHYIKPLQIQSLSQLADDLKTQVPDLNIVQQKDGQLLAYRQSTIYHFTDWVCIEANGNVSASATMGRSDFGKNRQLVESIRQSLKQ